MVDRGKEFLAEFEIMMANDYRILCNPISIRNTQTNAIVERMYQTIGSIIKSKKSIKIMKTLGKEFSH